MEVLLKTEELYSMEVWLSRSESGRAKRTPIGTVTLMNGEEAALVFRVASFSQARLPEDANQREGGAGGYKDSSQIRLQANDGLSFLRLSIFGPFDKFDNFVIAQPMAGLRIGDPDVASLINARLDTVEHPFDVRDEGLFITTPHICAGFGDADADGHRFHGGLKIAWAARLRAPVPAMDIAIHGRSGRL
jgi:hypothetical protein